jgi:mediator of RNA polymerase II transcription subunit 12
MDIICSRGKGHMESAGLSEYAKHCLREICSQEWVREKFLKENDQLFTTDLLLDKMITHRQVVVVVLVVN